MVALAAILQRSRRRYPKSRVPVLKTAAPFFTLLSLDHDSARFCAFVPFRGQVFSVLTRLFNMFTFTMEHLAVDRRQ